MQELNILLLMIDACNMQAAVVKDTPVLTRAAKQRFNQYFNEARMFTREFYRAVPEQHRDAIDDRAAMVLEILRCAATLPDPAIGIALLQALQRGEVDVQP